MNARFSFLPLILLAFVAPAQVITQTLRGKIVEAEAQFPLPGASVVLTSDTTTLRGSVTDVDGNFKIEKVPVGRHSLKITFTGYEDIVLANIVVSSAKETVLNLSMRESATALDEIVIKATRDGDASNEMAMVAARSFTVDETERYAGSRGDPARMASNFAGVMGADDSRNDIIIRGNSPQGVLWRMEGINIPNPNHFNIPGTAGGPVSMINNKTLANSDFYTGAFPAEYGNSIAGVFDLKLRNGNNNNHEFSGQFGFLGTEIFAEGPLSRDGKSSYLATYRYSTLAIFSALGIDIGTNAVPRYQDGAFKLNFERKNNGSFSVFGLIGDSKTDILISDQKTPERNIYGSSDRDQYFASGAMLVGASYKQPLSKSSYITASAAYSRERTWAHHEYIYRHVGSDNEYVVDALEPILEYTFHTSKVSANVFFANKVNTKNTINVGINADVYMFDFLDSAKNIIVDDPDSGTWRVRWKTKDQALLVQPFIQWKHSFGEHTDLVAGVHSQFFTLGNAFVPLEPRIALRYKPSEKNTWSFGVGLHSQIQAPYLFYYGDETDFNGNPVLKNLDMDFTRSLQVVGGYQRMLTPTLRLKAEAYYQHLFNIPVDATIESSFSLVNTGAGFSRFFPLELENTGAGRNYGAELTLEHFFTKGYLFLFTGSLFEAKYQGSDGVWRDTDFNGNYVLNALFSKEWKLKGRNTFSLGGKFTTAGGRRYGPVDSVASERQKEVIYVSETRNSQQFKPYVRADVRVNYRINRPKVTHEIGLDLVNVFDIENVLQLTWAPNEFDPTASPVREEYQLGFLPLFYYRIDF
jgi:hypothetical protein